MTPQHGDQQTCSNEEAELLVGFRRLPNELQVSFINWIRILSNLEEKSTHHHS